MLNNLEKGELQ